MGKAEELEEIVNFVEAYRAKNGVKPTYEIKCEPSCEAFGEGHNLLYCQLIPTVNGDGCWKEIEDSGIRKLVLEEIKKSKISKQ